VYRSFPANVSNGAFMTSGAKSGAICVPHITAEFEYRVAVGGATSGKKRIDYTVELQLFFRSVNPDPVAAMDDFDATVENLKVLIRSDRTLASANVWHFGEGTEGLRARYGEPSRNGTVTEIWGAVVCTLTEWITS
jgi:hypothetical protein